MIRVKPIWKAGLLMLAVALHPDCGKLQAELTTSTPVIQLGPKPSLSRPSPAKETNQSSAFELFKAFVANPPPIEEIKFSYLGALRYRLSARNRISQEPSSLEFYWARWQPNALICVRFTHRQDLELHPFERDFDFTTCQATVRMDEEFWAFRNPPRSVTFWKGVPAIPIDDSNPVLVPYKNISFALWSLLSMGPHMIPPGGIRWSDNHFDLITHVSQGTFMIHGELFPDAQGRAGKLRLHYKSSFADGHHEVNYSYGTNADLPFYLPQRIHSVVLREKAEIPNKDIRIISMKMAAISRPMELYYPQRWLSATNLSRFIYTNKDLYAVIPSGGLQLLPRPKHAPLEPPPLVLAHANRYYYVACVLVTLGFLIVNYQMRKLYNYKTSTERSTQCNEY